LGTRAQCVTTTVTIRSSTGRQKACPCLSGKKYKKCCALREHEEWRQAREERRTQEPPARKRALAQLLALTAAIGA
jgi:hypothetical protein